MRISRLLTSLAFAITGAGALATGAQAQDVSFPFTSDSENFGIFQFSTTGGTTSSINATQVGSGGNPGGFIRYTDPDSGVAEDQAYFVAPNAAIGGDQMGGTVSFDTRTNVGPTLGRAVFVGAQNSEAENISCVVAAQATNAWTHYSVTIDPSEECWVDSAGNDASQSEMDEVLGADVANWVVQADYSTTGGELIDLDNFAVDAPEAGLERKLTIKYKKSAKAFNGVLSQDEGPIGDECVQGVEVELYQDAGNDDKLIDTDLTDDDGKWKLAKKAKKGKKYYAVAPSLIDPACDDATSKTIKPL